MSCAGAGHEPNECDDVLLKIYEYLDGEMGPGDCDAIRRHLDECGPCLEEYNLDRALKALVHRSCGCTAAPETLRTQIMARITTVTVTVRIDPGD